jgi:hypothetical protein
VSLYLAAPPAGLCPARAPREGQAASLRLAKSHYAGTARHAKLFPPLLTFNLRYWNRFAYKVTEAPKRTLAQKIARKLGIAPRRVAK